MIVAGSRTHLKSHEGSTPWKEMMSQRLNCGCLHEPRFQARAIRMVSIQHLNAKNLQSNRLLHLKKYLKKPRKLETRFPWRKDVVFVTFSSREQHERQLHMLRDIGHSSVSQSLIPRSCYDHKNTKRPVSITSFRHIAAGKSSAARRRCQWTWKVWVFSIFRKCWWRRERGDRRADDVTELLGAAVLHVRQRSARTRLRELRISWTTLGGGRPSIPILALSHRVIWNAVIKQPRTRRRVDAGGGLQQPMSPASILCIQTLLLYSNDSRSSRRIKNVIRTLALYVFGNKLTYWPLGVCSDMLTNMPMYHE